jgi:hypothetical protein
MQTDKQNKISVSQYMKLPYKGQKKAYSRDTLIRRLRSGDLPEDIESIEKINTTYIIHLKTSNNGK